MLNFFLERSREMKGDDGMTSLRVGHGYDVHKLVPDRRLVLGGVEIDHEMGLLGHSDADVLVHAIMDSLLGAAALGDIGRHFPDSSSEYFGISSISLLVSVGKMIKQKGWCVVNVDATLILQKPKVAPYVDNMISNIAAALNIDTDQVNVKATTEEHLGFTGRCEGVSAHAVALIEKQK